MSKELAKTQTKVVESLETIETLRREVGKLKKSAPKELAEHQAKAEERLKSLQEDNDAVELKIKKWRAAHQAVLEEKVLAQKDFEEAMSSKTKHCVFLGGEMNSLQDLNTSLRRAVKGAMTTGVRTEKNLNDRLSDNKRSLASKTDEVAVLSRANAKLESKLTELRATRVKLWNKGQYAKRRVKLLQSKTTRKEPTSEHEPTSRKRGGSEVHQQRLINFRDPKSKRKDGRSHLTAEAHHARNIHHSRSKEKNKMVRVVRSTH